MKIAIIGSGVAGLTSAYLLAPEHEVTIFEKENRIGGHAHTLRVGEKDKQIAVDNGFMVFNPKQYPNFVALLRELNVQTLKTTMTFGVNIPGQITYRGTVPNGIFSDRSNIFNVRYLKFLAEIVRFQKKAKRTLQAGTGANDTLSQFLKRNQFSDELANWFLYPMLSAIWSIKDVARAGDFPALATFTFLNNHRLLSIRRPAWKTIRGGSIEYVQKLQKRLESGGVNIVLDSDIASVSRDKDAVTIVNGQKSLTFDYVLFATHADTTKQLLKDASVLENEALSCFTYTTNTTVLHADTRLVPSNKHALAAWNYRHMTDKAGNPQAVFTYCMNILQHIPKQYPVFVTLNPLVDIDPNKIYATEVYSHPQYNQATLEGQQLIASLQGKNRTLFAGAHLGYGFHEDGVVSAIHAVKHLGVTPPWAT